VPLLIVHPDKNMARNSPALFSAADLVPTLLGLAGLETRSYLEQLPKLAGFDLSGLVTDPTVPGARDEAGILAYWTGLTFLNHENVRRFDQIQKRPPVIKQLAMLQMMRETVQGQRGAMRGLITQRYKFARYFRPIEHNSPQTWETLVAANDIELYDLQTDPLEISNLAERPGHRDTVMRLNAQLNERIAREIGVDDGSFLPIYMRV
jgi:arylsulfatase A-like enzyme